MFPTNSINFLVSTHENAELEQDKALLEGGWIEEHDDIRILHVSGTHYEMGYQQGYYLKDEAMEIYRAVLTITDQEAIDACFELSRSEGIIPALESSHAIAHGLKMAQMMDEDEILVINLSGHGGKDIQQLTEKYYASENNNGGSKNE